ncbi:response regulator [Streptomyces sp. NPDC002055]|uniref:response regulator n=1 Tax=Streptomyces sp. NPDC002055 TaxID=3154534 RepID=UPI003328762E
MSTPGPEKSSILIVDDIEENLVALEAVLGSLDLHVVRARSGEEALKAMLREEFAVVLLDVLMPGMDGFETAANIKRLDQTKDVPVILLTGTDAGTDYAYRGYAIGAADFLTKPFDPWLLRTKVNVFLELYRKNRQLAAQAEQLRRLLVADGRSGRPAAETADTADTADAAEAAGADWDRPAQGTGGETAPGGEPRLGDVAAQLAQIELLLRDAESSGRGTGGTGGTAGLADRIADLERVVGRLRVGDDG